MYDTIIAGAGLAGACAALYLSLEGRTLLLDATEPASGASGAAAGMVNPLMSRRARPVWRMPEALSALHDTLGRAGASTLFSARGVLRPAVDPDQAGWFREAAHRHPGHARWLRHEAVRDEYPQVHAPAGALLVTTGGAIPVPTFVRRLVDSAQRAGAEVRTHSPVLGWGEAATHAWVDVAADGTTERLTARRVLLAVGDSWHQLPELTRLRLHRVKGQVVRISRPPEIDAETHPHLAGAGYVVMESDTFTVGSSYEHTFTDLNPSPEQSQHILQSAAQMLPPLHSAELLDATAGVRVNVPGTRLPMLGPLPGRARIWVFTGLGSKGLLMAPLLAQQLPRYVDQPERIPHEIRVRLARTVS